MNFQQIVLLLAIIILIIMLVVIGVTLSANSKIVNWPPIIGKCPDYWVDLSGNGSECVNSHNLGTCNLPSSSTTGNNNAMNFNQSPFNQPDALCTKYNWAKKCNVTWDGITSGITNPCNATTPPLK